MKTIDTKRWMPPGRSIFAIITLMFAGIGIQAQILDDCWVDWSTHQLHLTMTCEDCGTSMDGTLQCEEDENPWDFVGSYSDALQD